MKRAEQKHQYGHSITYAFEEGDFLVVDVYEDQFSYNWTARVDAHSFAALWKNEDEAKNAPSLVLTSSPTSDPIETTGSELFDLVTNNQSSEHQLVRIWLDDMTVAWQRGTSLGSGIQQVEYKPIVGLASDSLDGDFLKRFIDVTGKPEGRTKFLAFWQDRVTTGFGQMTYKTNSHQHTAASVLIRSVGTAA